MKTTKTRTPLALIVSALALTAELSATGDDLAPATATGPVKRYTGTIMFIDLKNQVINVKGWSFWEKKFNLGDNCTFALLEKDSTDAANLRVGQKITINYQDAQGVLIASRIMQEPMRYRGTIQVIDADHHQLVLRRNGSTRQMVIADNCKVVLRNGKAGSLSDLKVGNHVTVTYETPGGKPAIREVAQTSAAFSGTLTAIDLEEKTLKVEAAFSTKKFNVADNCVIVINGKPGGKLAELKPNGKLVLSYDEINGVNVVNRIAIGENASEAVASTSTMQ